MKGSTMLATLEQLGVAPSFSRPRVSNDNAYAESLFRTCKYRPDGLPEQTVRESGSGVGVDAEIRTLVQPGAST